MGNRNKNILTASYMYIFIISFLTFLTAVCEISPSPVTSTNKHLYRIVILQKNANQKVFAFALFPLPCYWSIYNMLQTVTHYFRHILYFILV